MSDKQLGPEPYLAAGARAKDSHLGYYTEVGERTLLLESSLDDYSYICHDSSMAYTQAGKFCSIAAFTRLGPGNHPSWRASQHHFSYRSRQFGLAETDDSEFFAWRRAHPVTLGHDVWVGHGVVIMPGVTIGTGAILGSGAVVTKDVPAYGVAVGTPARVIKQRFADSLAQDLMDLAWWDWSHEQLKESLPDMRALPAGDFVRQYWHWRKQGQQ